MPGSLTDSKEHVMTMMRSLHSQGLHLVGKYTVFHFVIKCQVKVKRATELGTKFSISNMAKLNSSFYL